MKKLVGLALFMGCYMHSIQAQQADTSEVETFDEILVSSQRFEQKRKESPRQIEVFNAKKLSELVPATLGDALINSGKVFVQKSQMGGSSPVLRGFEASRVLLVVDGIRMNNATYRAGHLQDIITIDPFSLERMEVNFGSGSTLFGSDALGGVIYLKTKEVSLGEKAWHGTGNFRFLSSSQSMIYNAGVSYQSPKLGWLLNVTRSQFGDLRMGSKSYVDTLPDYALMPKYVSRINDRDTVLVNADPRLQKGTGYSQTDILTKLAFKTGSILHTVNYQWSQADLIPRYDRMIEKTGNQFSYGRWDYAPQSRMYSSYMLSQGTVNHKNRLILGLQQTEVGRITRGFGKITERTQLDHVSMYTVNADRQDKWGDFTLNSGFEYVYNSVHSSGTNKNILTQAESVTKARYADSGASTHSTSLFTQGIYHLVKTRTTLQVGLRLTNYSLNAQFKKINPWKLPYQQIAFRNTGISYDIGVSQLLTSNLMVKASYNQAFRNPNVDDMTKVFESSKGIKLLVPSPNLLPEISKTVDLGVSYSKANVGGMEVGYFNSQISNLLLDQPGQLDGQDSLMYDGTKTRVYQMVNMANAKIQGYYFNAKWRIWNELWLNASYTYTYGRYTKSDTASEQPLDHIPPVYGQVALKYAKSLWYAEVQYLFNGTKLAADYSNSGEDNADKNPVGGNPTWGIFTVRGGFTLGKWSAQVALENLGDLRYRYFASGVTASGRSVNVTLGYKF